MPVLGKFLLRFFRYFHRWHRHHLEAGLLLLVLSGVGAALHASNRLEGHLAGLPAELEHLIGLFTIWFFAVYVTFLALARIAARFWPPPVVPALTGLPEPTERPATGHWIFEGPIGPKFKYRFAQPEDLPIFVNYSLGDIAIVMANPELDEHERLLLYQRWYSRNSRSFMLLDVQEQPAASWRTLGVSIVLPLSEEGATELWTGRTQVIGFEERHIWSQGQRPVALLIDTLAVQRRDKRRAASKVFALAKAHTTRFWVPEGKKKIEYWIEPDHRVLPKLLRQCGFEGPHEIGRGHKLFKLIYPLPLKRLSERQKETVMRFIDDLRRCSTWRIV
jgi:hypothetical protein